MVWRTQKGMNNLIMRVPQEWKTGNYFRQHVLLNYKTLT